jgi:hypothetical protein
MKEFLYLEEESSSMSLTVSQISDRDYEATEELFQSFANFIKLYGNYLNREDDVSSSDEEAFLLEYEKVVNVILEATERIRHIGS